MANEIVKYDNIMNQLEFKNFEQKDFDLLMALCSRMRDLGEETQVFEYDYLMDLIGWDKTQPIERFHKDLIRMNEKLASIKATIILNEDEDATFVLFPTFRRNLKKRELKVSVNKDFKFILNELSGNFTRFELKEYVSLDSRYTKQLYAQIKQRYKLRQHFWQPTVDELRQVLSIPDSYTTKRIYTLIVEPAVQTIKSCKGMKSLEVEVLKERRRGNPVKGYKFTWTPSDQLEGQMSFDDFPGVMPGTKAYTDIEKLIKVNSDNFWKRMENENKPKKPTKPKNSFNNFEQNTYNFAELEEKLLDN